MSGNSNEQYNRYGQGQYNPFAPSQGNNYNSPMPPHQAPPVDPRGPTSAPRHDNLLRCPQCHITPMPPPVPQPLTNGRPLTQRVCEQCRLQNIDEQTHAGAEALMALRFGLDSAQCDVCRQRRVPAGQRRCPECVVDPDTPTTPSMAFFASQGVCVVCERNYAAEGAQHCANCSFEGQRSEQPLRPMDELRRSSEIVTCYFCGLACPRAEDALCPNCRRAGIPAYRDPWGPGGGELVWSSPADDGAEDGPADGPEPMSLDERLCGCGKFPVRQPAAQMCVFCHEEYKRVGKRGWATKKKELGWPTSRFR